MTEGGGGMTEWGAGMTLREECEGKRLVLELGTRMAERLVVRMPYEGRARLLVENGRAFT